VPLLWAEGSGADVMKRIAAPMVGGLVTSAFLTLEIIPVIYTYWRNEQLLVVMLVGAVAAKLYAPAVAGLFEALLVTGIAALFFGATAYFWARRPGAPARSHYLSSLVR
jgi:hypothetical protein